MTNGIPAPQTFIFEKLNRDRLFQNLPLISKPVNGSSSEGIQIIRKTGRASRQPPTAKHSLPIDRSRKRIHDQRLGRKHQQVPLHNPTQASPSQES